MNEPIDNLILEHLRAVRADLTTLKTDVRELTHRMGRVEVAIASFRRDLGHTDEIAAEQSVRLDRLSERIERLERRLDLSS